MQVMYQSTRGKGEPVTASQAILKGLSEDGGLFVPTSIPSLDVSMEELSQMSYQETAYQVMSRLLTDFTEEELRTCINSAYDKKFDTDVIAPLKEADGAYFLELFHGPTIAFKDMALSILPYLMTTAAKKNNVKNEIVILTATSGDTGKAALAGFADVPGTRIIVFYPKHGVSPIQEKQMVTQKGANTYVVGITGKSGHCKTKAHSHLLSGLVFCGDCGRPMTFCRRSSGRSFVLICSGYSRYGECQRHTTDEAQLERTVLERLNGFAKQVLPSGVEEALLQSCSGRNEALWMQEKTHAQERFNQIGSILQALYEDRAAQRLEESEFTQLAATYREEKRKLQSLLEGGHLRGEDRFLFLRAAHKLLYFEQPDRRLLCRMIRRITIASRPFLRL